MEEPTCNSESAWGIISNPLVIKFAGIVLLFLVAYLWYNTKDKVNRWGLSLVFLGGLVNLVERFYYGCVIDDIKAFEWYPNFNMADLLVIFGAAIVTVRMLSSNSKKKQLD